MAREHAADVHAVIRALTREGVSGRQIWLRLTEDRAELGRPVEIGLRTVQDHAAKVRDELIRERDPLQEADEISTADAIQRQILRTASLMVDRIADRVARDCARPEDPADMREWGRQAADSRRYFAKLKEAAPRSTQQGDAAEIANTRPKLSALERLAAELESEGTENGGERPDSETVQPASSDPAPPSAVRGEEQATGGEASSDGASEAEGRSEGGQHHE